MAKTNTENLVEARAKVNLKYDKTIVKIGDTFQIRESDIDAMLEKGYIDYVPPVNQQTNVPPVDPPDNGEGK
jgi:hypothetical protein